MYGLLQSVQCQAGSGSGSGSGHTAMTAALMSLMWVLPTDTSSRLMKRKYTGEQWKHLIVIAINYRVVQGNILSFQQIEERKYKKPNEIQMIIDCNQHIL